MMEDIKRVYLLKANHTEKVYKMMQSQFIELAEGKPDLEWEEMWTFYDRLDQIDELIKQEHFLLKFNLWDCLRKPGKDRFFKLSESYFDNQEYLKPNRKMTDSPELSVQIVKSSDHPEQPRKSLEKKKHLSKLDTNLTGYIRIGYYCSIP